MEATNAGSATGEANKAAPTTPITKPMVLIFLKNDGVGASTRCASVRSGVFTLVILVLFIVFRVKKESFNLFYFGFKLTNPEVDQLQATFKFTLDERRRRFNLGNILLHPYAVD